MRCARSRLYSFTQLLRGARDLSILSDKQQGRRQADQQQGDRPQRTENDPPIGFIEIGKVLSITCPTMSLGK
jgi:hypothetical protein